MRQSFEWNDPHAGGCRRMLLFIPLVGIFAACVLGSTVLSLSALSMLFRTRDKSPLGELILVAMLFSPLLLFPLCAFLSRPAIRMAVAHPIARIAIFWLFAGFPMIASVASSHLASIQSSLHAWYTRPARAIPPTATPPTPTPRAQADAARLDAIFMLRDMMPRVPSPAPNPHLIYISLPDDDPTCAHHRLPPLADGMAYHCAPSATLGALDGSGWLPLDLRGPAASGSGGLPIDPVNTAEGGQYLQYHRDTTGAWEICATLSTLRLAAPSQTSPTQGGDRPTITFSGNQIILRWGAAR